MDLIDEHADPVGIAPRRILVAFPIQNEHRLAHVWADGVHEMVGLTGGVAAARVMVEAKALAALLHASRLAGHVSVGEPGALRGLDHGEVVVGGASDRRGLPAGHVDAVHIRQGQRHRHARGEQYGGYRGELFPEFGHGVAPSSRIWKSPASPAGPGFNL